MRGFTLRVVGLLSAVCLLAGCQGGGTVDEIGDGGGPSAAGTHVVDHELGSSEVSSRPERVIALDPYYSLPTALLAEVNVVGATHQPFDDPFPPYLEQSATTDIENVGWLGGLKMEKIAELQPDVIIGLTSFVEEDYERLSEIAPTVGLSIDAMQWKQTVGLIAEALGAADQVAESLEAYEERATAVAAEIESAGMAEDSVSILNVRAMDDVRVYTKSCAAAVLNDVGVTPHLTDETAEGDNSVNLSIELLTKADADTMFYFVGSTGSSPEEAQAAYEKVSAHPLWKQLEAVRTDRAFSVDANWWFNCGSVQAAERILDDVEQVAAESS